MSPSRQKRPFTDTDVAEETAIAEIFARRPSGKLQFSAKDRSVQVQISIGHDIYSESCRYCSTARGAIDFADTIYRSHRRVETVDEKSGHAIIYQFGHRPPVAGDHWSSAGQCFDDRQAKWLIEIDEVKQRVQELIEQENLG